MPSISSDAADGCRTSAVLARPCVAKRSSNPKATVLPVRVAWPDGGGFVQLCQNTLLFGRLILGCCVWSGLVTQSHYAVPSKPGAPFADGRRTRLQAAAISLLVLPVAASSTTQARCALRCSMVPSRTKNSNSLGSSSVTVIRAVILETSRSCHMTICIGRTYYAKVHNSRFPASVAISSACLWLLMTAREILSMSTLSM